MGANTAIGWTNATWNPVRGCSRVSDGCRNCYAERVAARFSGPGQPYEGLARRAGDVVKLNGHPAHDRIAVNAAWTGEVRMVPEHLADPLKWKKPRRIFVNSMSDLFHEKLSNGDIAAVFGVMASSPKHTFQVLTKRPERMREWFGWAQRESKSDDTRWAEADLCQRAALARGVDEVLHPIKGTLRSWPWPLQNVWMGVSVEDQRTADERIPILLEAPAAVRFLSVEPMLGPVDLQYSAFNGADSLAAMAGIDWVIIGCESGHGRRPLLLESARHVVSQCRVAGVAVFVKQIEVDGKVCTDVARFPPDFRIQEFPR